MSKKHHSSKTFYLPEHKLRELLHTLGITIAGDTGTDLICYCCFHSNRDSPAMNISKSANHLWKCHNGRCGQKGNIVSLITKKGYTPSEAQKMVTAGIMDVGDLVKVVERIFEVEKPKDNGWAKVDSDSFALRDAEHSYPALKYLEGRGIGKPAYDYFKMGYAPSKNMLTIPVFDDRSNLCGVIGREIEKKRYQYSTGLARSELIWNINNAKKYDEIILTEGALDAVYLWQAGYENVGAVLGSVISPEQWKLLRKYFHSITCFFDNDEPGQALAEDICDTVTDLSVSTVRYPQRMIECGQGDESQLRPPKDAGELTVEEIRYMLDNRLSSLERLFKAH